MQKVFLISCLNFLLLGIQSTQTAKIVGYPMFGGSQYIGMKRIAEELVSRGHEVTILVSQVQKIKPAKGITHVVYQVPYPQGFLENLMVARLIKEGPVKEMFSGSNTSMPMVQRIFCEALLNDTKLLEPLKNFDVIITDTSMFCGPLVAEYLGLKRIEYCPMSPRILSVFTPYESIFTLSYIPLHMSHNPGKMNFLQRIKNTIMYIAGRLLFDAFLTRHFDHLKQKYNIRPERSFRDSLMDTELTLFLADFAVEYSYPILPGFKLIGPLNIQPVKPLPPDLQQLIDSSGDDGFIIVSFGSNVASVLDKDKVDIMAEAFGRLKQKVVWRLQGRNVLTRVHCGCARYYPGYTAILPVITKVHCDSTSYYPGYNAIVPVITQGALQLKTSALAITWYKSYWIVLRSLKSSNIVLGFRYECTYF
ncbi:2-hydroxyacylsphingosine 1-beta-galactosyltransferase-like [Actinia tenebrosa]|uniref:2-hydroxyacylsphingosine 1-beta-galactosyltransferase-like n=1 Tax=Actinia tenebrosa TaxID=6105 RepID=A0A6P8HTX2_ACTTE|nr:2-hydroxyacylsphingosine 1-beta-galactosyltransferase-like [Actinia tenebrosa]